MTIRGPVTGKKCIARVVERTEDYVLEADRDRSQDPRHKASNSYTKSFLLSKH